jgi:ribosome biogenesis GTPase
MAKKKKTRVELRKNRSQPPREHGWTRGFDAHGYKDEATLGQERVRAKGELSRKRTIIQDETAPGTTQTEMPTADTDACMLGRVLRSHGLVSVVEVADGRELRCSTRRVLKNLASDERNVVTTS